MITQFFHLHWIILYTVLFGAGLLAAFIDAVAGGGGLVSVPILMLTGLPISVVFGTNKAQSLFGMALSVYKYYKAGLINFKTVYRGLILGVIGALIGAYSLVHVSNEFMKYIVPFLMLAVFFINLFNKNLGVTKHQPRVPEVLFFSIFGFIWAFYDAFFGPGVGNFWIMCIVFILGYNFLEASGYAKMMTLKSTIIAVIFFVFAKNIDYSIAGIMIIGQFIGAYLGSKLVLKHGAEFVRPFFMVIVFINIILLFYQLITGGNYLA